MTPDPDYWWCVTCNVAVRRDRDHACEKMQPQPRVLAPWESPMCGLCGGWGCPSCPPGCRCKGCKPAGDTQCDPRQPTVNPYAEERAWAEVRVEHGPGLSWSAYAGDRLIAKQAPCISPTPWPKRGTSP